MKRSYLALCALPLVVALLAAGCSKSPEEKKDTGPAATAAKEEHGHSHVGPHDGTVTDWGGGTYHVEFTVDHDKKEATIYVLGGDLKKPAPVKAETLLLSIKEPAMQVELKPVPQEGDPAGSSSRFVGTHEKLGVVQEYGGTISGEVDGIPYAGDFQEEPHGHEHGTDHGHKH